MESKYALLEDHTPYDEIVLYGTDYVGELHEDIRIWINTRQLEDSVKLFLDLRELAMEHDGFIASSRFWSTDKANIDPFVEALIEKAGGAK